MPENRVVFHRSTSAPLAVESRYRMTGDFETIPEENCCEMYRSTESLDSLDLLPDIVIPPLLRDPLPLQCLAASALPKQLREELDSIVEQYSGVDCEDGDADGQVATMSVEEDVSSAAHTAAIENIVLKKDILPEWGNDTYNEIGLSITGGVHCARCKVSHAVITKVSPSVAEKGFPNVKEGLCVVQWCGQSLQGASFERVKAIIQTTAEWTEVELTVKDCTGVDVSHKKWYGVSNDMDLSVLQRSLRRKSRLQSQDDSDFDPDMPTQSPNLSPRSVHRKQQTSSLEPPLRTHGRIRPLSDDSGSLSPEHKSLRPVSIEVPTLEVTPAEIGKEQPQSRVDPPQKTVVVESSTGYLNGAIQLVLEYDGETEYLKIRLCHANTHASKENSTDSADVFINTYLIPDSMEQGVRSVKVTGASSDVENTPAYSILPNEMQDAALRVTLWDASKSKQIVFKGEVLLPLSDMDIVDLTGKPMWFTMYKEDPNLPRLPKPVHYKQKHPFLHRFKNLTHSAQAVSNSLKQQALKTSNSISTGLSDLNPSQYLSVSTLSLATRHKSMPKKTRTRTISPSLGSEDHAFFSSAEQLVKHEQKQQKFASIMRVLKASVSNTKSEEDLSADHDFSTLDRGIRRSPVADQAVPERPLSDSFPYIPSLRGSLYAKNGRQVTAYSFLEEMGGLAGKKAVSKSTDYLDRMDKDAAHYQLVASYSTDELDSAFDELESDERTKSLSPPASDPATPASASDCDSSDDVIDSAIATIPEAKPSLCPPVEPKAMQTLGVFKVAKYRSKSVGDTDELDSDEEEEENAPPALELATPSVVVAAHQNGSPSEALQSSLEIVQHEATVVSSPNDAATPPSLERALVKSDDAITPMTKRSRKRTLSKWSSLDNILGNRSRGNSKSKKGKKSSVTSSEASARSRTSTHEEKGVVNVKLQLSLNDFNPASPVLVVKVTDIRPPSKDLSTDYTMKCCVIHNSTGVCVIKKKLKISPRLGAPLGFVQFDTDIINLSLQVSLSANRLFSKKRIGQVSMDLSSLHLSHDTPDCRWYQFRKNT